MNEYIEIVFRRPNGRVLKVTRQTREGAIVFEGPDPEERPVAVQLMGRSAATRERMARLAALRDWRGAFRFVAAAEGGSLVLRGVDQDAFPEGVYTLGLAIRNVYLKLPKGGIRVDHNRHAEVPVTVFEDVRDIEVDLTSCDAQIRRVLDASEVEGRPATDWLADRSRRATRRACLLNLLASLRVRPSQSGTLLAMVREVYQVMDDRIYTRVDAPLFDRVEALVADESKPFYREGEPNAAIHKRLLGPEAMAEGFNRLISYRGEGKPSLQIVLARPVSRPHTYAEFDLDLGNPLQDAVGFIIHMGELLDGKPTNHLDLWKPLAKTRARDFLYYRVTTG